MNQRTRERVADELRLLAIRWHWLDHKLRLDVEPATKVKVTDEMGRLLAFGARLRMALDGTFPPELPEPTIGPERRAWELLEEIRCSM